MTWCAACRTKFNCLKEEERGKVMTDGSPHIYLVDESKTLCGKGIRVNK